MEKENHTQAHKKKKKEYLIRNLEKRQIKQNKNK